MNNYQVNKYFKSDCCVMNTSNSDLFCVFKNYMDNYLTRQSLICENHEENKFLLNINSITSILLEKIFINLFGIRISYEYRNLKKITHY